jgi:hypothetical protein
VGRIKSKEPSQQVDWQMDRHTISSKNSRPEAPQRKDFASDANYATAKGSWTAGERKFWLSEVGREAQVASHRYLVVFATDGSFRINDVAPGTYRFDIWVSDPSAPDAPFGGKTIGSIQQEIVVPDLGPDNESSPLDLGVFDLVPSKP